MGESVADLTCRRKLSQTRNTAVINVKKAKIFQRVQVNHLAYLSSNITSLVLRQQISKLGTG